MAGYLLWRAAAWPGSRDVEGLPEWLRGPLRGASWSVAAVGAGPGGVGAGAGHLLVPTVPTVGGSEPAPMFAADGRQVWQQAADGVWVGWETGRPPGPADLLRPDGLDGSPVKLGAAAAEWLVPVVHAGPWSSVPNHFLVGATGEVVLQPDSKYAELVTEAAYWWEQLADGEPRTISKLRFFAFGSALLAVNYRVWPWLVGAAGLDLLTDRPACMLAVVAAALGYAAMREELDAQKKTGIVGGGGAG